MPRLCLWLVRRGSVQQGRYAFAHRARGDAEKSRSLGVDGAEDFADVPRKISVFRPVARGTPDLPENHGAMRAVAESLSSPKRYRNTAALQEDAVRTALRAFGLAPDDKAASVDLAEGRETALARVSIMEDSAVEHDARYVPGYDLIESHLTGRAVFTKNGQRLEIFTANRRELEHVFGVDLIYLNATHQNIVMLQYKMLEPTKKGDDTDWIYRPDATLDGEIKRMRKFADPSTGSV